VALQVVLETQSTSVSHHGGVWEHQIRSVKAILTSLLHNHGRSLNDNHGRSLNDEEFQTFLVEVEAVINSRLLTTDTLSDVNSPLPLLPSNLLTMKSNVISPPPRAFNSSKVYSQKRWRRIQHLLNGIETSNKQIGVTG